MDRINGSVGRGGQNQHADVLMVQKKLNENLHIMGGAAPVREDGTLDTRTQDAIIVFQRVAMRIPTPDGRVDPQGRTWRMLTGDQGQTTPSFIQLPGDASEYYIYTQPSKVFGTSNTILSIKSLAAKVKGALGVRIGIGDISYQNGGHMPPHDSHTLGVDVDIRPLRTDKKEERVTIHEEQYSRAFTKKLVEIASEDTNLRSILFNDTKIAAVKQWAGHDNHLHVRFKS